MKKLNFYVSSIILLSLIGCGGSNSKNSDTDKTNTIIVDELQLIKRDKILTMRFTYSGIKGINYHSTPSGIRGITNEKGEVKYKDGDTINFAITDMFDLGKFTPGKKRLEEYTKLCEDGFLPECNLVGYLYANSLLVIKKDFVKAAYFFQKACDEGNNDGCNNIKKLNNLSSIQ